MQFFKSPTIAITHSPIIVFIRRPKLIHKFMAGFWHIFGTFFRVKPATVADSPFLKIFPAKGAFLLHGELHNM